MNKFFYGIANFFGYIFDFMPTIGNKINYFYVLVIFTFLVVWALKMIKHKKDGQEHSSS